MHSKVGTQPSGHRSKMRSPPFGNASKASKKAFETEGEDMLKKVGRVEEAWSTQRCSTQQYFLSLTIVENGKET